MGVGWRRLSTESAGDGEKRLWLTGLRHSTYDEQVDWDHGPRGDVGSSFGGAFGSVSPTASVMLC